MRTLLLAPHADDETLFASYLAQRHAAYIVCVYDEGRVNELTMATQWLGCRCIQWGVKHGAPRSDVVLYMEALREHGDWQRVIAPAVHEEGHDEHNLVGEVAADVFSDVPITWYLTYAPRGQRDRNGQEVMPDNADCIARKLAALSCYRSQITQPSTAPWFYELLDMREWVA